MGFAWARPDQQVYCLSGDIAFLYDKNAWWCNPMPANISVVVINNGGGMIFDRLQGPEKMPGLRDFMHTPHHFTAQYIATHYSIPYRSCNAKEIKNFTEIPSGIMEIFTA
jgi:2-succinyl-5-enolpyruvyl-6-hydroxy-3-cyclohexene-1-carboxylate synthase